MAAGTKEPLVRGVSRNLERQEDDIDHVRYFTGGGDAKKEIASFQRNWLTPKV